MRNKMRVFIRLTGFLWLACFGTVFGGQQDGGPGHEEEARAAYRSGLEHYRTGQRTEAVAAFRRATSLDRHFSPAFNNLAYLYDELEEFPKAVEAYRRALELRPDDPVVYTNLAVTYRKMGRSQEALASLRRALALRPGMPEAHNNLGVTYHQMGRYREAVREYRQAIAQRSDYADAHYNLGVTYLAAGEKARALEQLSWLKGFDTQLAGELFGLIHRDKVIDARRP